jgi:hypothetical protein
VSDAITRPPGIKTGAAIYQAFTVNHHIFRRQDVEQGGMAGGRFAFP